MYIHIDVYTYEHILVYIYIHIYTHTHVYTHVISYIYIYMYISISHTHNVSIIFGHFDLTTACWYFGNSDMPNKSRPPRTVRHWWQHFGSHPCILTLPNQSNANSSETSLEDLERSGHHSTWIVVIFGIHAMQLGPDPWGMWGCFVMVNPGKSPVDILIDGKLVNIPHIWCGFNHPFGAAGFLPSTYSMI